MSEEKKEETKPVEETKPTEVPTEVPTKLPTEVPKTEEKKGAWEKTIEEKPTKSQTEEDKKEDHFWLWIIVFLVLGFVGMAIWRYRDQIKDFFKERMKQ